MKRSWGNLRTRRTEGERGDQRDPWNLRSDEGGIYCDNWDRNREQWGRRRKGRRDHRSGLHRRRGRRDRYEEEGRRWRMDDRVAWHERLLSEKMKILLLHFLDSSSSNSNAKCGWFSVLLSKRWNLHMNFEPSKNQVEFLSLIYNTMRNRLKYISHLLS